MKTEYKSMFNSFPRSFNCLRTESADFCSLNGRTIRTDCRSGVELRRGAGVGDRRVNKMFRICQL